jgi:hypothetical protein
MTRETHPGVEKAVDDIFTPTIEVFHPLHLLVSRLKDTPKSWGGQASRSGPKNAARGSCQRGASSGQDAEPKLQPSSSAPEIGADPGRINTGRSFASPGWSRQVHVRRLGSPYHVRDQASFTPMAGTGGPRPSNAIVAAASPIVALAAQKSAGLAPNRLMPSAGPVTMLSVQVRP